MKYMYVNIQKVKHIHVRLYVSIQILSSPDADSASSRVAILHTMIPSPCWSSYWRRMRGGGVSPPDPVGSFLSFTLLMVCERKAFPCFQLPYGRFSSVMHTATHGARGWTAEITIIVEDEEKTRRLLVLECLPPPVFCPPV